jgi:hypothetical protein
MKRNINTNRTSISGVMLISALFRPPGRIVVAIARSSTRLDTQRRRKVPGGCNRGTALGWSEINACGFRYLLFVNAHPTSLYKKRGPILGPYSRSTAATISQKNLASILGRRPFSVPRSFENTGEKESTNRKSSHCHKVINDAEDEILLKRAPLVQEH